VTELAKERPPGTPVEIWFQDEARVGQKNGLVCQWAKRGSRPRQPKDQRTAWADIFGAVCPARDKGAALVLPRADTEAMQRHLEEISRTVAPGAHGVGVMDKAGWHTTAALEVPANLSLLPLPPYSPELNPQANIGPFLRQTSLPNRVFDAYEAIVDACCKAGNALLAEAGRITSIATRTWAAIGQ
jgi:hypothetical protein